MRLEQHTAADFAQAIRALMPLGVVWEWPEDGLGDALMRGPAQELARVDAQAGPLLDTAIALHRPKALGWRLVDYRAVVDATQVGVSEVVPRPVFVAGGHAGQRLWSDAGAVFDVPTHALNVCRPFVAGSHAGQRCWGPRARYVLEVRYYATVANLALLRAEMADFKQSHMLIFFIDITNSGGEFYDA